MRNGFRFQTYNYQVVKINARLLQAAASERTRTDFIEKTPELKKVVEVQRSTRLCSMVKRGDPHQSARLDGQASNALTDQNASRVIDIDGNLIAVCTWMNRANTVIA
jgi:hypothetical protein